MSDEQVQWQETILHAGTVEERDAAYAAFRLNKNGQYFVYADPEKQQHLAERKLKLIES